MRVRRSAPGAALAVRCRGAGLCGAEISLNVNTEKEAAAKADYSSTFAAAPLKSILDSLFVIYLSFAQTIL